MNVTFVCSLLLLGATAAAQVAGTAPGSTGETIRASGSGGFPLTDSVTSLWGAVDEVATPTEKTMSFMIYYRGAEGWHKRKWTVNADWFGRPFVVEFKCDLATLRAEVDREKRVLTLLDQHVDLSKSNVVFVDNIDQPGKEVITVLGHANLTMPADVNPALWVLQQNGSIRTAVFGPEK